jgi:DNA polymerase-3 subunit alpha
MSMAPGGPVVDEEPPQPKGCKVALSYSRPDVSATIELGESWRVEPADELFQDLEYLLGQGNAQLVY